MLLSLILCMLGLLKRYGDFFLSKELLEHDMLLCIACDTDNRGTSITVIAGGTHGGYNLVLEHLL